MDYKKPIDAVQFIVLSSAELLPNILKYLIKQLDDNTLSADLLKSFHALHTSHALISNYATRLSYLEPRIMRRIKIKSDKVPILTNEYKTTLKKAKDQANSIIAALKTFLPDYCQNKVIKLMKSAILKMKSPKSPNLDIKIGAGDKSRTYVVGGATDFNIRDRRLEYQYGGNPFKLKPNESLEDLVNMPINDYFNRIIDEYGLKAPVESQMEMSSELINKIKEKIKQLYGKYETLYNKCYLIYDMDIQKYPVSHEIDCQYIENLRREISKLYSYLAIDKANRDGIELSKDNIEFPTINWPQYDIQLPVINKLQYESECSSCPKDILIAREGALKPYLRQAEIEYGKKAEMLGKLLNIMSNYDVNADIKALKKYGYATFDS